MVGTIGHGARLSDCAGSSPGCYIYSLFQKIQLLLLGRIVPLSERQQMVLLKRIEENRKQATSPKPDNPQVNPLLNPFVSIPADYVKIVIS